MQNDLRITTRRVAELEDRLSLVRREVSDPDLSMVGKVYNAGAMPTTLPGVFAVRTQDVAADPTDGDPGSLAQRSASGCTFLVIGDHVPTVGDTLVARLVDGVWVAESPSSAAPDSNQLKIFAPGCGSGLSGVNIRIYSPGYGLNGALVKGPTLLRSGVTNSAGFYLPGLGPTTAGVYAEYWVEADHTINFWVLSQGVRMLTSDPNPYIVNLGCRAKPHWTCASLCGGVEGMESSDTYQATGAGGSWTLVDNNAMPPGGLTLPVAMISIDNGYDAGTPDTLNPGASTATMMGYTAAGGVPVLNISMPARHDYPSDTPGTLHILIKDEASARAQDIPGPGHTTGFYWTGVASAFVSRACNAATGAISDLFRVSYVTLFGPTDVWINPWNSGTTKDFTVVDSTPRDVGGHFKVTVSSKKNYGVSFGGSEGAGTPVYGTTVVVKDSETGSTLATGTTDATLGGTPIEFDLPKRRYLIDVEFSGETCYENQVKQYLIVRQSSGDVNPFAVGIAPKVTVDVTCVDCIDGTPLAGMSVTATNSFTQYGTGRPLAAPVVTGSDGKATLVVWSTEPFTISATKTGKQALAQTITPSCTSPVAITAQISSTQHPVVFRVTESVTGLPIAGATVNLQWLQFGIQTYFGTTDSQGKYTFTNMGRGVPTFFGTLVASKAGYATQSRSVTFLASECYTDASFSLVPA